jgi:hypothetical protein
MASANIITDVANPSSAADDVSTSEDIKINEDKLVQALAARIEVPVYGVGTLRRYLEDAEWVLDTAYEAFVTDRRTLGLGSRSPSDAADTPEPGRGLPDNIRGAPVAIHDNQEEQRREAMRLLRVVINVNRDPNNQLSLTLNEAFFSLVLTSWDVEAAAIHWESADVVRWELHHTFDHLRATTTDQIGMDERVARLVHFTGRDDWHSARAFLAAHNQRFMQAVQAWYRQGMPVVRARGWHDPAQLYVGRRVTYDGQPRSAMPFDNDIIPAQVSNDTWAPDETSFRPAGDPPSDAAAQPSKHLSKATKRKRGFCFTPEGDAPVLGGVIPQHFTIDYLQNGKYRANGFGWENWYRPELPESDHNQSSNPQFNQYVRDHVANLGKWIRQEYSRIEGTSKRSAPQAFSKEEKRFLYELCKRHLNKMLAENPGKTSSDFRPLEFRKGATEKLEKDFNEKFEGTKPESATEPRRHRTGTALKVKCARMKKLRDAFGFHNAAKGDDDDDFSEWSDDEQSLPSNQIASASLTTPALQTAAVTEPPSIATNNDPGLQRRQQNIAEEDSRPELDTLAFHHRRVVRAQAEQYWVDNGVLFPSEDQITLQMRINLQNECVNGKHKVEHAAVVRHLMRLMGMVIPEELVGYASDDEMEMEMSEESVEDATDDKTEAEEASQEQDNEIPDIDDLEFEPEFFDDDVLGSAED